MVLEVLPNWQGENHYGLGTKLPYSLKVKLRYLEHQINSRYRHSFILKQVTIDQVSNKTLKMKVKRIAVIFDSSF